MTKQQALKKAESYCAYQERCHKEVKTKLYSLGLYKSDVEEIMAHLIEHGFLNEERFANEFVRGKFRIKKWGRKRLQLELRQRDISTYLIKTAISQIPDDEYIEAFNKLAEKKMTSLKSQPKLKQKRKLADYLLYRGWESHLVYDKVNQLID
ncbi:MAG: regulatory protein RecX [Flavobacteriaceae bacterium]|nr:regulatory protein RecX [Flavobacteriaceae bacterium]